MHNLTAAELNVLTSAVDEATLCLGWMALAAAAEPEQVTFDYLTLVPTTAAPCAPGGGATASIIAGGDAPANTRDR